MKYVLLDGDRVDLASLGKADLAYLFDLQRRALAGEVFWSLKLSVSGKRAYPLKGSLRVTRKVHRTPLYRVAEDVVDRVGLRQGTMSPDPGGPAPIDQIVSASEAARMLGITRAAVIKAAHAGRLKGKKIGETWALLRESVESYVVSARSVAAGRARRSG